MVRSARRMFGTAAAVVVFVVGGGTVAMAAHNAPWRGSAFAGQGMVWSSLFLTGPAVSAAAALWGWEDAARWRSLLPRRSIAWRRHMTVRTAVSVSAACGSIGLLHVVSVAASSVGGVYQYRNGSFSLYVAQVCVLLVYESVGYAYGCWRRSWWGVFWAVISMLVLNYLAALTNVPVPMVNDELTLATHVSVNWTVWSMQLGWMLAVVSALFCMVQRRLLVAVSAWAAAIILMQQPALGAAAYVEVEGETRCIGAAPAVCGPVDLAEAVAQARPEIARITAWSERNGGSPPSRLFVRTAGSERLPSVGIMDPSRVGRYNPDAAEAIVAPDACPRWRNDASPPPGWVFDATEELVEAARAGRVLDGRERQLLRRLQKCDF